MSPSSSLPSSSAPSPAGGPSASPAAGRSAPPAAGPSAPPVARPGSESPGLAAAAAEQVRAIVEAAEQTAGAIRGSAEVDARRARESAVGELRSVISALAQATDRLQAAVAELGGEAAPTGADAGAGGATEPAAPGELLQVREVASDGSAAAAPDRDGARLVALEMALAGTPREQTADHLAEHYAGLPDADRLLDEVYAAAS